MSVRRIEAPDTEADKEIRSLLDDRPQSFALRAGAGSGKTTSLVKALAHIERTHGQRMRRNQQQVACITYTELAAAEIFADVGESPLFQVSTIHSFLWSVISPFQRDLHRWVTDRVEERIPTLQERLDKARGPATTERYRKSLERASADKVALPGVTSFTYQTASRYRDGVIGHADVIAAGPELMLNKSLLSKIVAQRFPFILVDESQDTFPNVVDALAAVEETNRGGVCVGYFGDPVQKIYPNGVGQIPLGAAWRDVTKAENFRCPVAVLDVVNRIRAEADGLEQRLGKFEDVDGEKAPVQGNADLFILPADSKRTENLGLVRAWLANSQRDEKWTATDATSEEFRVLVIEHRIAAERLGFTSLFEAFNNASRGLDIDFREGSAWPLRIFQNYLFPLASAWSAADGREVLRLIRLHAGELFAKRLDCADPSAELASIREAVGRLAALFAGGEQKDKVRDALRLVIDERLAIVDERLADVLEAPTENASDETEAPEVAFLLRFLDCPLAEIGPYCSYVNGESPYVTQQGVKGAEFERVLVVLDDEESRHFQFSYDKLFGLRPLSETDRKHLSEGAENVIDRARRLLYVCCSRATRALAVVFYTASVDTAVRELTASGPFSAEHVHILDDLTNVANENTQESGPEEGWTLF